MIPNAVTRQSRARIAWRFSSGRNISIPKTVPSDDARQSPLVVIAKKTYAAMRIPHSKVGLVPRTSQPGGRLSTAPTAPTRQSRSCLLYTSDAADEEDSVDLGGG